MRCISYLIYIPLTVFVLSFALYFIGDVFGIVYSREMDVLTYGFNPEGMPEFNWKINFLLWSLYVVFVSGALGLVCDEIGKRSINSRKIMPAPVAAVNFVAVPLIYLAAGMLSGYSDAFCYFPRFFLGVVSEAFSKSYEPRGLPITLSCLFHGILFSCVSAVFHISTRKRQLWISEREKAYKEEYQEDE